MKLRHLVPIIAAMAGSEAIAQSGVSTQIEFGRYLNCYVYNGLNRPIEVRSITYLVDGDRGPASNTVSCNFNCTLAVGASNKFSGPSNESQIRVGDCRVNYRVL